MSDQSPEGYLGTSGRISSGPAPELIEAGYRLELADAGLLHRGLHLADLAHVISLDRRGLLPTGIARALLAELLELAEIPVEDFPFDVRLGDAYNSREHELARRAGDLAGWVHLGRTRREAGRIAFRLAVRDLLLDLGDAASALTDALASRAESTATAVWADHTYLQPAQPSTFGHFLASFAEEAARHLPRLRAAYDWVDTSPAGSGGVGGTRLGLDRQELADLLGFSRVGRNIRDTMWNLDGLIDAMTAATQVALTADRLAEDLLIFTSPSFGVVELDSSHCRASVLMPQKRNPYALAVIRAGANTMIGRLTGLLATARTPSGQTDNWLHTYGEVASGLTLATRLAALAASVVRLLTVDLEALARQARQHQIMATDLAEELTQRAGMDYRTAYRVVANAVASSLASGTGLTPAVLDQAAAALTGRPFSDGALVDLPSLLDPELAVASRGEPGSCAPDQVVGEMATLRPEVTGHLAWSARRRVANRDAEAELVALARAMAGMVTDR